MRVKLLTGCERKQSTDGTIGLAECAHSIAGVLAGPRVRRTQIRKETPWRRQPPMLQVPPPDVGQLVTDNETYCRLALGQRELEYVRVHHHEVATQKPGGERIEKPARLHHIHIRDLRETQPARMGRGDPMKQRKLSLGDPNRVPPDPAQRQ